MRTAWWPLACRISNVWRYSYHPQTKLRKGNVFYTCVSVILFTGGEGSHHVTSCYGQHHAFARTGPHPPGWHAQGWHSPLGWHPLTVNKRAVRILLECFLITIVFAICTLSYPVKHTRLFKENYKDFLVPF